MSKTSLVTSPEDIAIVGMAGRFPGARNVREFWRNLRDGIESISRFAPEELEAAGVPAELFNSADYVPAGTVVEDAESFDAAFFGFNIREAEITDPQQRVFLECSWEALEDAGYDPEKYPGAIGVFAGSGMNSYLLQNLISNPELLRTVSDFQLMIGNDKDFLATRASYKLNLKGPSVCVQTACSTSLVAVQMACQSLIREECDMALAGGVSILFPQISGYTYVAGMILSPDGHCRAFDASARGTVPGKGAAIVVLKRLQDALKDRDSIHAVIKGSAINNDGSAKVGYTAPSVDGQAEVIMKAQAIAGFSPDTISYVETHGTGTELGDPIEIAALTRAFRARGSRRNSFCFVGSVKTNIGHLDTAAGTASLIKCVLAMQNRLLPPSLHFTQPNPHIGFENSPFRVATEAVSWNSPEPLRAGVSSFGIGGTNAHVCLEQAPRPPESASRRCWHILPLSARTDAALQAARQNLWQRLEEEPILDLTDVAYTLQVGRKHFGHRSFAVCRDSEDARAVLASEGTRRIVTSVQPSRSRSVAFLFSGQGSQYANMARGLYDSEPLFRETVDVCCELLRPALGLDLRDVMYGDEDPSQLNETWLTQPALFVIEYALAKLWMKLGIQPAAMIGHSIGEYVAACIAGVFSLEDALSLVAARGRMMQQLPKGSMLVVQASAEEISAGLNGELSIAAVNAPSLTVVSGGDKAIASFERKLDDMAISSHRLHTSHAFHSEMMDPILRGFKDAVAAVQLQPPQIPFVSNVTGDWITAAEATDPSYWSAHLRRTVRFSEGVRRLIDADRILLEIGPGRALTTMARQQGNRSSAILALPSLPHPQDSEPDRAVWLTTLGKLWLEGLTLSWDQLGDGQARRVSLPTYPFQRQRLFVDIQKASDPARTTDRRLEKRQDLETWFYVPSWKRTGPASKRKRAASSPLTWMIFLDSAGIGEVLARELEVCGYQVIRVSQADRFLQLNERVFQIRSDCREDYDLLFRAFKTVEGSPRGIVHLWSVQTDPLYSGNHAQQGGFFSLLHLMQAFDTADSGPLQLEVVTNNLHDVAGERILAPERATIFGMCAVIPREFFSVHCRAIDLNLAGVVDAKLMANLVLGEVTSAASDEAVAYRGPHRWTQTYEPVTLLDYSQNEDPLLAPRGVYLITGGLGGLGLKFAEYLAYNYGARLVLTSRTGLPSRDEWATISKERGEDHPISKTIRKIAEMEAAGAEVLSIRADAANADQMCAAIDMAVEKFGKIDGVIHAAGISERSMIFLKDPASAHAVLAPKVQGSLILDRLLEPLDLRFFLLCSSIASITPVFGLSDYAAANAFLDTFAHERNMRLPSQKTIAVNWDTWQEVGMAANTGVPTAYESRPEAFEALKQEILRHGITPSEGITALARILRHPLPQVVVSTRDLYSVLTSVESASLDSGAPNAAEAVSERNEAYQDVPTATGDEVEQTVIQIWTELLGTERISINDDFFELGGHSLLGTQVLSRIRKRLAVELPLRTIFEARTVAELAEGIKIAAWAARSVSAPAATDHEEFVL